MQQFRRFTEGALGKFFMVLITLPFVIAGFYGYSASGGGADQIAKVGNTVISKNVLSNEIQSSRQQIRQSNPELDLDMISQFINPSVVLDGLINNALLDQAAESARIVTPQEQVLRELVAVPLFQDANGNFSRELFNSYVARLGYSPNGFIQYLQTQAAREQLKGAYTLTDFATSAEFDTQVALASQTRSVVYTRVALDSLKETVSADSEDVKNWYEQNKSLYMRPAQIRLSWVEINPDNYVVEATAEQLEHAYQARKAAIEKAALDSQTRQISDIFIATGDERDLAEAKQLADELAKQLQDGADFSALAQSHSDDPVSAAKGGQMGWLTRDALPEDMSKPAFALQAGEVSAPIQTADGYHLLKVTKINSPSQALDEDSIRKQVESEYADQEKLRQISEDSNLLADLAYEHSDLVEPANQLNLPVQTTDWFDPLHPSGFAATPAVASVLQNDEVMSEGENSSLLNLGDNRFAVVRLEDRRSEALLPFNEVSERVANDYATEQASQKVAALKEIAADKASADDVSKAWHSDVETLSALKRNDNRLPADVVEAIFDLPPAASGTPLVLTDSQGNLVAVWITDIGQGEGVPDEFRAFAVSQMALANGQHDYQAYVNWLRTQTKIKISEDKLNSL